MCAIAGTHQCVGDRWPSGGALVPLPQASEDRPVQCHRSPSLQWLRANISPFAEAKESWQAIYPSQFLRFLCSFVFQRFFPRLRSEDFHIPLTTLLNSITSIHGGHSGQLCTQHTMMSHFF